MDSDQYKDKFKEITNWKKDTLKESETRAGRALAYATDIRKFEIELYWKRATYFWTFIGAAFAGYALTYKSSSQHEPWLSLIFSSLGLIFSLAWHLVNRGSKFWQNNWERHVDLLEDITLGPLYKIIAEDISSKNPLTAPGQFSVTKINQILSVFVTIMWSLLFLKSLLPISFEMRFDGYKFLIVTITILSLGCLWFFGKSSNNHTKSQLRMRGFEITNSESTNSSKQKDKINLNY